MHLIFNSIALLSFGRLATAIYGHGRFLAIYLVSGIAGTTFSYLLARGVSAGATSAIFGVVGALAVFFAVNRRTSPLAEIQGRLLAFSMTAKRSQNPSSGASPARTS